MPLRAGSEHEEDTMDTKRKEEEHEGGEERRK
jgi:hypothetical protein